MDRTLKLQISEKMKVPVAKVWQAITDPATIKKFMWGTEASSTWKKGSVITFQGIYEGKPYHEKGEILEIEKEKLMKYTYLTAGLEDKEENYAIITYQLSGSAGETTMTVTQEGAKDQAALDHSKEGWKSILGNLKKIVES